MRSTCLLKITSVDFFKCAGLNLTRTATSIMPWWTFSIAFSQPARPGSDATRSPLRSTRSAGPYDVGPVAWRGGIGSQNHKWIALPGSNPSVTCTCTNAIVGRRGTTGRLKLQRMLTNRSGYVDTFNALLGRGRADRSQSVPSFSADEYLTSFTAKVFNIRKDTDGSPPPVFPPTAFNLSTLTPVTSAELRRIILESPPKSCELDPLPTSLLQEFVDVLLPLLTVLCNRSIRDGILPASQKRSILVPALKCEGLDSNDPVNYRPIANVSFVSKVIEKIIAFQMTSYLETNNLLPGIQSGFRKGHSTETLLLRLLSDVYAAIDSSQVTLLALFDVSAAFDTVDHEILLKRLSVSFGLSDTLLLWLRSYLTERSLCVVHGSSWVPAPFGLPQGSVLAPLLFIMDVV